MQKRLNYAIKRSYVEAKNMMIGQTYIYSQRDEFYLDYLFQSKFMAWELEIFFAPDQYIVQQLAVVKALVFGAPANSHKRWQNQQ